MTGKGLRTYQFLVVHTLSMSLQSLSHRRLVANLSIFYRNF